MNPLVLENRCFAALFVDVETARQLSTEATLGRFVAFEIALARALGKAGAVPAASAAEAAVRMASFVPDVEAIAAATVVDGVPVPEFVRQLKAHVGAAGAPAVHHGATSQDVVDTAQALALREIDGALAAGLRDLTARLRRLGDEHGANALMGRTRMQAAAPIAARVRIETWRLPLEGQLERLDALRPRVERLQLGGAVGDRAVLGAHADAVARHLSAGLGLADPPCAWHTMRDALVDYAGWLSLTSGALGKLGQDVALMAQQGVDEIVLGGGGSSSAMPHKSNPVLAETLVAMARYNAVQLSGMHQAMVHEQERSGAAWTLEWMILPAMIMTTRRAIALAERLVGSIERIGSDGSDRPSSPP